MNKKNKNDNEKQQTQKSLQSKFIDMKRGHSIDQHTRYVFIYGM